MLWKPEFSAGLIGHLQTDFTLNLFTHVYIKWLILDGDGAVYLICTPRLIPVWQISRQMI